MSLQNSKTQTMETSKTQTSEPNPDDNQPLTYKDIEPIVEYLVKVKARDNRFDCWDTDDIGQEIRIICLYALDRFEPSKAKSDKQIINYFGRCVDNRLKNLKRDKYIRFNPSIAKDKIRQLEENPKSDPQEYKKLEKFKEGLEVQKRIKHPINIEVIGDTGNSSPSSIEDEIVARDMQRHLIENIEDNLRPSLIILLTGDKRKVNIRIRRRIQASVRTILEE